ncbi:MAG: NUDIX hydrolase [Myxococcota bacterium]
MTVELRPASTVLLLRDGTEGLEVFMVQRHHRSGFMPNAWVFPGGRVDETDQLAAHSRVLGTAPLAERLARQAEDAAGFGVAAVRETFEESGVWLGTGQPDATRRKALHAGELSMAKVLEDGAGPVDLGQLIPWAWWVTPKQERRRFEALFFAVPAQDAEGEHDTIETVDSRWIAPKQALAMANQDFPLAPPTWWTLIQLAKFDRMAEALARPPWVARAIEPIIRFPDQSIELLLPGHPEHPDPAVEGYPDRITFDQRWRAWRGADRIS